MTWCGIPEYSELPDKSGVDTSSQHTTYFRLTIVFQTMAKKCVHKGCGKTYENEDDECLYHPGPPVFHEGQKGQSTASMPWNPSS
jgi:hypothetical protein